MVDSPLQITRMECFTQDNLWEQYTIRDKRAPPNNTTTAHYVNHYQFVTAIRARHCDLSVVSTSYITLDANKYPNRDTNIPTHQQLRYH